MPMLALPNELLLKIAQGLLPSAICHCDCDCRCHHISPHLSAFSRVNQRLHALLAEYLLATASPLHILFWAVANSRTDTVALALERGADANTPRRPESNIKSKSNSATSWDIHWTPVDLAISMRQHSVDAKSHALKLATLALLLGAGGTCRIDSLIMPTHYGDLDLLTLCLPQITGIEDRYDETGLRTLLATAAGGGHAEATKLVIHAGASVNSTGEPRHFRYYPPLWVCWHVPMSVLQVLLDAGADATWEAADATWAATYGVTVLQNMRHRSAGSPELEEKIALLVRYGAVDEGLSWRIGWPPGARREHHWPEREYRGWVPGSRDTPVDWAQGWALISRDERCTDNCY
ncbi:hypothetical protein Q9L58_005645 [Maublancomyces gigas]|uniref:Ankyrin repeat protein n=1 Tax=Discina gigas TaxID=1032678 RepID=A0ABR3GHM2_9PEZI